MNSYTLFVVFAALSMLALFPVMLPVIRHYGIPPSHRIRFVAIACSAYVTGCLAIYGFAGAPQLLPLMEERDKRIATLASDISANLERVKADRADLGAWVALGTAFLETGQLESAVNAFKESVLLSGGDASLILAYAKAQVLQADGKVTDAAAKGFEMVRMQRPDDPEAQYFMALRSLQQGDTQSAMRQMKSLYHSLPDDSPVRQMINKQIGRE